MFSLYFFIYVCQYIQLYSIRRQKVLSSNVTHPVNSPCYHPSAFITYALWVSHNDKLEPALDWRLNMEGRVPTTTDQSTVYTFLSGPISLDDAPDQFCGQVYVLGQVDVHDQSKEENKDNNIRVVTALKVCPTGEERKL